MVHVEYDAASALSIMHAVFPDIEQLVKGRRVIDFGCGYGYQAVAYARAGARSVIGIELDTHRAALSEALATRSGVADRVTIQSKLSGGEQADLIISQNSFEHFLEPEAILRELQRSLACGGRILITFGPPWFAPTGAHMAFFCRLPWVQLLFSEQTIMEARSLFRFDGASTYREAGLGQMSVMRFEAVVKQSGMRLVWRRYDCVKGLNLLRLLPGVRELAVNRISCILELSQHPAGPALQGWSGAGASSEDVDQLRATPL